jgi:hypothetical protein
LRLAGILNAFLCIAFDNYNTQKKTINLEQQPKYLSPFFLSIAREAMSHPKLNPTINFKTAPNKTKTSKKKPISTPKQHQNSAPRGQNSPPKRVRPPTPTYN